MSLKTVRDILEEIKRFHRQLGARYQAMKDVAHSERVKLLLDYLGRHEEYLETAMDQFDRGKESKGLGGWFKNPPCGELDLGRFDLDISPDATVDEILRIGLAVDDALIRFYTCMANQAPTENVRDLFDQLLRFEQREERMLSRTALGLEIL